MAVPKVRADYDQLKAAAGQFGGQAQAVASTIKALQRDLTVLEGGDWLGTGATAFYQEMGGQVLPTLKRLAAALEAAQQTTAQINQVMAQAEAEAARWLRGEGDGQNGALGGAAAAAGASALFSNGAGSTGSPAGTGGAGGATAKPQPQGSGSPPTAADMARGTNQFNQAVARILAEENAAVDNKLAAFSPGVRAMVKQSATLRAQMLQMQKDNINLVAGPPGSGFSFDRQGQRINIEQPMDDATTVSLLAHEVGHGVDKTKWTPSQPTMFREEYVQERVAFELIREGRAQFNAVQVRQELLARGGPDIGIPGTQDAAFQQAFDDFTTGKITHAQAIERMGNLQSTERPSQGGYATYRERLTDFMNFAWDVDVDEPVMLPKRPGTP